MMTFRISATSPYARKVRIAVSVLGLEDQVKVSLADTYDPADQIRTENPLGKVPTLLLDDGRTIYDSLVILEFLNDLGGGEALIPRGSARIDVLVAHALASGMTDAALLRVYEKRWRPAEMHSEKWLAHHAGKMERALDAMEAAPFDWSDRPHIGAIAKACGLGFLDLRFGGEWRKTRPKLVARLDDFSRRVPAFEATAFGG
ncbi:MULTISPECIES: glutathione S-transferase N-terminal domain-containing protein [Bradyrhizobium]|jgi:glutathione S-transferase|nr:MULTISPECIES: glutathione S-transferase N-terminal domain-containing protein [Bradyrhizobium]MCS3448472.1 glutathione S-transferase [Bradyrhizobium elkanii]MCS3560389.1 glutathione S-transferase [Bradyrhizobium elkanii]MCW2149768.1 glutathione S-transferase [Bradyrhizobium elkanii]MCW2360265.1 glutathione S-transferase [Bradyrhizobium elkanii]MCW2373497.1 glutathione S-transferase [Bradyrhizobium elkanii]